ncbi:MAG TPA: Nramp family divalent metal transporter, partial [Candidatus Dormibacteraeota bacterium]|nr:Nramp family divalent metal transporter [Candidatus Dormibacteraeota bacterium]
MTSSFSPLPLGLQSRNPLRWLSVFGPGAIIASLTIGVGELVFSSRGGAIFGYRLLWFFGVVLAMKWVLVFASARQMILTGAHPFQRWMDLPGPRGWLPMVFFLLAIPCFPIWVSFHAGTLGTLLGGLTGTEKILNGGGHYAWGLAMLLIVLVLCASGGYAGLEKIQIAIVVIMLGCVVVAVFFVHPHWLEFLRGLLVPQPLRYPSWIEPATYPEIASRPVWVETSTYVGIIGGSGYDYLAYVSYLRDKQWGRAGAGVTTRAEWETQARDAGILEEGRRWLRVPLIDCLLSFAAVLIFTAVFVICGSEVLGPQHKVPDGSNLLQLQAEFVTSVHPWLRYVYFAGAFLAVFGTLYGTVEVAPTILREMAHAIDPQRAVAWQARLRGWSVGWAGVGALFLLIWFLLIQLSGAGKPPGLITLLTPANLFT